MLRVADDPSGVAGFGHRALVQDEDAVADLVGGGQVVGDVQEADAEIVLQLQHDVEDHRPR